MAVSAASINPLFKDILYRPPPAGGVCSTSVSLHTPPRWTAAGRCRGGPVRAAAFWDVSRPMSIVMQPINGVEELDQILQTSKELSEVVIIDWMANWCRKCIYLKPKLEKLAAEFHPRIKFYYVDVNNVSQALVKRGNISKMPTIQLWKDGEWKAEIIGGHQAWLVMDEVREMIQKYK